MSSKKSKKSEVVEIQESPVLPIDPLWLDHHLAGMKSTLEHWRTTGKPAPVLLLTGIPGIGKREMAYSLAQWIFCENSGFSSSPTDDETPSLFGGAPSTPAPVEPAALTPLGKACGKCVPCQKALHDHWVDFEEIQVEGDDSSDRASATTFSLASTGTIKIEQLRELKATQGFGAFESGFRVTLIRDADRLTTQAANSLLKLLEEPPPGWILILTATDPSQLLPTLVSRCQVSRLRPLPEATLIPILQARQISADRARTCATFGQGSVRKAAILAEDEIWDRRTQILKFLDSPHIEFHPLVEWASSDVAHLHLMLDQLEQAIAEFLRWSLEPKTYEFWQRPLASVVKNFKQSPSDLRRFWAERAERIFRARQEALTPVNKKLLVQDVLAPFCL